MKYTRNKIISITCLIILINTTIQAQLHPRLPSGCNKQEQDSIISLIKEDRCNEGGLKTHRRFLKKINRKTQLLRIYTSVNFHVDSFTYNDNVLEYLKFQNDGTLWLIDNKKSVTDSIFAVATSSIDDQYCYVLGTPDIIASDNYYYNLLKSVISKIDIKRSYIFSVIGKAKELFILTGNIVYVVDGKELVLFNDYYKKRYTSNEFKELFNIPIR